MLAGYEDLAFSWILYFLFKVRRARGFIDRLSWWGRKAWRTRKNICVGGYRSLRKPVTFVFSLEFWNQDSQENKTNCLPRDPTLSV